MLVATAPPRAVVANQPEQRASRLTRKNWPRQRLGMASAPGDPTGDPPGDPLGDPPGDPLEDPPENPPGGP